MISWFTVQINFKKGLYFLGFVWEKKGRSTARRTYRVILSIHEHVTDKATTTGHIGQLDSYVTSCFCQQVIEKWQILFRRFWNGRKMQDDIYLRVFGIENGLVLLLQPRGLQYYSIIHCDSENEHHYIYLSMVNHNAHQRLRLKDDKKIFVQVYKKKYL